MHLELLRHSYLHTNRFCPLIARQALFSGCRVDLGKIDAAVAHLPRHCFALLDVVRNQPSPGVAVHNRFSHPRSYIISLWTLRSLPGVQMLAHVNNEAAPLLQTTSTATRWPWAYKRSAAESRGPLQSRGRLRSRRL